MKKDFAQYEKLLTDIDGVHESELKRIKEKSSYNYNFYFFVKGGIHYLILGESDDDTETAWWWCIGDARLLIGYSWINEEVIHVKKNILT